MSSKPGCSQNWAFGTFELEGRTAELRRNGVVVRLQEQPSQLLLFLLQHAGQIVTREDLRLQLWPADTFVDFDHALNTAVMKLREALGDSSEKPLYIQTLPRQMLFRCGGAGCHAAVRQWPFQPRGNARSFAT